MKKNSKWFFLINLVEIIRTVIISLPLYFLLLKKVPIFLTYAYVLIIIIVCIRKWLNYFFITYQIKDQQLLIKNGIIFRKKMTLTTKTKHEIVHDIKVQQPFMYKFIKQYKVILLLKDEYGEEIEFQCLDKDSKEELFNFFSSNYYAEEAKDSAMSCIYRPNMKIVACMSFLSINYFIAISILYDLKDSLSSIGIKLDITIVTFRNYFFVFILLIFLVCLIIQLLRFGNFSVWKNEKAIFVKSGVLDSSNKELNLKNINSLVIKQNLFMRLFSLAHVYGLPIKSDQESKLNNLLFPYITMNNFKKLLKQNFKNFSFIIKKDPNKQHLFIGTTTFLILFLAAIVSIYLIFDHWFYLIALVAYFLSYKFVQTFTIHIEIEAETIILYVPGLLGRKIILLKLDGVEIVSYGKRKHSKKYKLVIYTNSSPTKKYVIRDLKEQKLRMVLRKMS